MICRGRRPSAYGATVDVTDRDPSPAPSRSDLRTPRLAIRIMRSTDATAFAAYRNDPLVAKHQLWDLPYTPADAAQELAGQDELTDLRLGGWTQLAVELRDTPGVLGDVCCHLDDTGAVAEIGFTFATEHQGHGYAREAAGALLTALFERPEVVRVTAELDPPNIPSQRVLEAIGLRFEALTHRSFLWRGEWTDNLAYAVTRDEYDAWRAPRSRVDAVELVPLTTATYRQYVTLETHYSQRRFVDSVLDSYGDALFPEVVDGAPLTPRLWGVDAFGEPVGFVMCSAVTPDHPEPYLWRLLVDRRHQGRGVGTATLAALVTLLRAEGVTSLRTSWVEGAGSPRAFYERLGFVPTGRLIDAEVEGRLAFG